MGIDLSSLYMHEHRRGHGEYNEYLYYVAPAAVLKIPDEQQQLRPIHLNTV